MSILLEKICCIHWLNNEYLLSKRGRAFYFLNSHYFFDVKNCFIYRALLENDYEIYNKYIEYTNQKDHSEEKLKNLLENFEIEKMDKIDVVYNRKWKKFKVIDGTHRISILLFKNLISDKIPIEYLRIRYEDEEINQIKEVLRKTKNINYYNGWNNNRGDYGYHSYKIGNINLEGQRNPIKRLEKIKEKIDFRDKRVIDFGCNSGGMILHLPEISEGWGFDFSEECIIACKKIRDLLMYNNKVEFIQQDLNNFDFDNFISESGVYGVDVIFLLSLGSWIKEWKNIYKRSYEMADKIVLETNNEREGIEQIEYLRELGGDIEMISESSDDDITGNRLRKMYIVRKK